MLTTMSMKRGNNGVESVNKCQEEDDDITLNASDVGEELEEGAGLNWPWREDDDEDPRAGLNWPWREDDDEDPRAGLDWPRHEDDAGAVEMEEKDGDAKKNSE
jgi:hypothetical protein